MEPNVYKSPESNLVSDDQEYFRKEKLTAKTIYKLLFIGYLFGLGTLLLLNGIYDLTTGSESIITFNEEKLTGISGFIGLIVFIPIFSAIMSSFTWLFTILGLWIYNLIFKPIRLEYK